MTSITEPVSSTSTLSDATSAQSLHQIEIKGAWTNETGGGSASSALFTKNPQYGFVVKCSPTNVVATLTHAYGDNSAEKQELPEIALYVARTSHARSVLSLNKRNFVAVTQFRSGEGTCCACVATCVIFAMLVFMVPRLLISVR